MCLHHEGYGWYAEEFICKRKLDKTKIYCCDCSLKLATEVRYRYKNYLKYIK